MADIERFKRERQHQRPHHIDDWCRVMGWRQVDLAERLDTDKSLVSRWFNGASPSKHWQQKLAEVFHIQPEWLFRHPNERWIANFFEGRTPEEIERIKKALEALFPPKA